jgi:hypothetical protein
VVGAVSQTVEVSSSTTQVDTTSTQIGDVIESKKMTGIPLNGRSYIDLMGLQAGVTPVSFDSSQNDRLVSAIRPLARCRSMDNGRVRTLSW